ncbi:phosphoribosylamine---glycine ligase, partial [Lecanoromycetidae sp. Uapishka_2]
MEVGPLRILLVGSGGREHALCWKLAQSAHVEVIHVCPGNGGTALVPKTQNVGVVSPDDFTALLAFCKENDVNFVIPGPEVPLVNGIGSFFRAAGIRCFGPTKAAARMEGSKTFSKDFMARHEIPTAEYKNFDNLQEARKYLDTISHNVVIKATGLAAGKGVILPGTKEEAHTALNEIMGTKEFGSAGDEVVIEDDGYTIKSLPAAQDHKQIYDGDFGPNTGGMGCYAPTKVATRQLVDEIHRTVLQPTIDGMRKERMPFVGLLFTGFMITKDGPKCLEYNVRFGDPEAQTLLPLMDGDLAEVMVACTEGWLDSVELGHYPLFSATVVASAAGYPGKQMVIGEVIKLEGPPADTQIFHAGTKGPTATKVQDSAIPPLQPLYGAHDHIRSSHDLRTSGGRVIAATSTANSLKAAVSRAYKGMSTIQFNGMHFRKDIAHRALAPESDAETAANGTALTYASAGVSIADGNSLVQRIKSLVASTARPGASAEIGGFGGAFDLVEAGYSSPITIIGGMDGVGTKLNIAHEMGKHGTIGIDLVAMNVNDLVVQGAEPLTFMDTYTCSKLDVDIAEQVIKGICTGCIMAGCALVGGETAEMQGLLRDEKAYDIVGTTSGAVEKGKKILPDKTSMRVGDVLLGLASNGPHSNGYSLIRLIIRRAGLTYWDVAPWGDGESVGESLLTPTRIYVKPLLQTVKKDLVKGMSHITGGGLLENVPRMLPKHLAAEMSAERWPVPKVLKWLKEQGRVEDKEFATVFNTGLGMVLVVSEENVEETAEILRAEGETVYVVGTVVERQGEGCVITNMSVWA